MEASTLYYFFSTTAQVLAAISALLAIFTQFKLSELNSFLIGDGEATFKRMSAGETGYNLVDTFEHKMQLDRLRDAIGRKSILGILNVINVLANEELKKGKSEITNHRGLQYLKRRFEERTSQIRSLKVLTKTSITIAFVAILFSLISIIFVQNLTNSPFISLVLLSLILLLSMLSMTFTIQGVYKGLMPQEDV